VRRGLEEAGIDYEIAPRLVRGLDYYNRTVFEFFTPAFEAAQSALGGGGRYDPLAEMVGSRVPVAGVGVALGCERIVAAMPEMPSPRLDLFVAVATLERSAAAGAWVRTLRAGGHRVDWTGGDRSLKSQFKAADRSGAAAVAIVGEEWASGRVRLKRLATGEEAEVDIEEVGEWLDR
jgi:histidyl-tRNA synthetase